MFGASFSRAITDCGKSCIVIDKLPHIGGACYSEEREGIHIHSYGAHIFHTDGKDTWDFVNRFASFKKYIHRINAIAHGDTYSFPINLMTLRQLWGVQTAQEATEKLENAKIPIENPQNLEEWALSHVGEELYELFIKGYTTKQWQRSPKRLPTSIIKRLPIRLTDDDAYFNDAYQGIPCNGYTAMFNNMLSGIPLELNTDYFEDRTKWNSVADTIIYTGKIDEFFDSEYGELSYRTLRFEIERLENNHQKLSIVNYCDETVPYTRTIEHKHFNPGKLKHTFITKEYPDTWDNTKTPYYPIRDKKNSDIYAKYNTLANNMPNMFFRGRLAEYKYYDMHHVVSSALSLAEKLR